ncbi:MAG: putative toxin-antitoxin system toxin component, PIN family [Sphingobacteriales bacterium]
MIVVLDCNIWVSLAINSQIDFIADLSDNGITIATCSTLRDEITDVLRRPKLRKFISEPDAQKVIALHDLVTTSYLPRIIPNILADPKDNYLFALALKSKADFLVTGDKLILEVAEYKRTRIIKLIDFKEIVQ